MDIEIIRDYCLSKDAVTEGLPFDNTTLVFKVMDKIFLITSLHEQHRISIKCKPDKAIELREEYNEVTPAYHMNKSHWNSININGSIPDKLIFKWIDDSYQLIVNKLPLTKREELLKLKNNK